MKDSCAEDWLDENMAMTQQYLPFPRIYIADDEVNVALGAQSGRRRRFTGNILGYFVQAQLLLHNNKW